MVEPDSVDGEGTSDVLSSRTGPSESEIEVVTEKLLDDNEAEEIKGEEVVTEKFEVKEEKDKAMDQDGRAAHSEVQSNEQEIDSGNEKGVNESSETGVMNEPEDAEMQDTNDEKEKQTETGVKEIEGEEMEDKNAEKDMTKPKNIVVKTEINRKRRKKTVKESGKVENEVLKENEESAKERENEVGDKNDEEIEEGDEKSEKDDEKLGDQKKIMNERKGQKGSVRNERVPEKEDKYEMTEATKVQKRKRSESKEPTTPASFVMDRPVRVKKSVERLEVSIERGPSRFVIEKGQGTALGDIPNVYYKLSKKKNEATIKALYPILFGRKGKASECRSNIFKFSGFVWHENEEKRKTKVKEKLDKLVKGTLFDFCDVLDVPIAKSTSKKEEIVEKLLTFMIAPHATTDVILADKEQSNNSRKRNRLGATDVSKSLSSGSKKWGKSDDSSKDKKSTYDDESEEDEDANRIPADDNEFSDQLKSDKTNSNDDDHSTDSELSDRKRKIPISMCASPSRKAVIPKKTSTSQKQSSKKSSSKLHKEEKSASKSTSRKEKDEVIAPKKKPRSSSKSSLKKKSGSKGGKVRSRSKKDVRRLSKDELRQSVCDILKEVDFNTSTFTDILKQLGSKYGLNLTSRKGEIKVMVQEELIKIAEAEDEEDSDDEL